MKRLRRYMPVSQCCEVANISKSTFYKMISTGEVNSIRPSHGTIRIDTHTTSWLRQAFLDAGYTDD
jgi:excisionase family DNA binding protein